MARPFLNQNQLGGSIGGPVIKNKLFFYTNYEAFRLQQGTPQNHTVLTPDARKGIFTYLAGGATQKVNMPPGRGPDRGPQHGGDAPEGPHHHQQLQCGRLHNALSAQYRAATPSTSATTARATTSPPRATTSSRRATASPLTYTWNRDILDRPD